MQIQRGCQLDGLSCLEALVQHLEGFVSRHIATSDSDHLEMLALLGVATVDVLIDQVVPSSIRMRGSLTLPDSATETQVTSEMQALATRNIARRSLRGRGYYGTVTPPVIKRNFFENPAWYTSYTPYQPEISQGRLEALLTFQTLISELTGLPVANASLLDEGTACAEAMSMARRVSKSDSDRFLVDIDIHPQNLAVILTRAEPVGIEVVVHDFASASLPDCFGALICQPGSSGNVKSASLIREIAETLHSKNGLLIVDTDPLFCVLSVSAGSLAADIAIGSMQRFGIPMGFGGPHAAFISTREEHARALPGRLVGVSVDANGKRALRLALQTREQHIRREKATSNICTAQALLANGSAFYAMWHGYEGLRSIAERVHDLISDLAASLTAAGYKLANSRWFDTLTIVECDSQDLRSKLLAAGFDATSVNATALSLSLDETVTAEDLTNILTALAIPYSPGVSALAPSDLRHDDILRQEVFRNYRTEHAMLRYLRKLSDMDLALDRTMIPLGSCTMKLNATTEMEPITWPGFANMHPLCDSADAAGYFEMIGDLEEWLAEITGYDTVSLAPNAGSQGEFAGLLAIRGYHRSRGDAQRTVCLIPSSAHGTNAASAVMCGMSVVVVNCDPNGNVDIADLESKVQAAGDTLAALMITYPSTHGVFESAIQEICAIVHHGGGQVYLDGANLNAMVGLAQPGKFGADVSHLNLHKTFCIPHGGGGPGVGPVAVKSHLAPFIPARTAKTQTSIGRVSSAPFGSAGILPIAWAYIRLMGAEGLTKASKHAILNANYLAARLGDRFPILYSGQNGRVAHECILDLRDITKTTGVSVDDVAKRLMDFGFHAPTMSFPVAGTLMVEPTESENKEELDRFVDAMLAIADEIECVRSGVIEIDASPLRHAPHTIADLCGTWERQYTREQAVAVGSSTKSYFPPVRRIDSAHGDRNLICTCEPLESFVSRDEQQMAGAQSSR